jgi:hypothetical protein
MVQKYEERLELARKSERKWHRTLKSMYRWKGDNKMVKEKQEVVHKARRQSQVNLITFDCLLFLSLIVK